jgi:xanthine/uracil permease
VALLGGASIVVFGLITVAGAKIWIDHRVDFSQNSTLIIAAVSLIMGAGNFSLHIGAFDLGGIGTATLAAIVLNLLLNRTQQQPVATVNASTEKTIHPATPHSS